MLIGLYYQMDTLIIRSDQAIEKAKFFKSRMRYLFAFFQNLYLIIWKSYKISFPLLI